MPRLLGGDWRLLAETPEGKWIPVVSHLPKLPLTDLQKRWLKAILSEPGISLFLSPAEKEAADIYLKDTEPLFYAEDFYYFDRYRAGDPFELIQYQENFRTVLEALRNRKAIWVAYEGKRGNGDTRTFEIAPDWLEYSSRDDKFRLYGRQWRRGSFSRQMVMNLSRIRACHLSRRTVDLWEAGEQKPVSPIRKRAPEPVQIAISGEQNSLERCMLHFASYEKHMEYDETRGEYLCSIYYDEADETELLIEILSFGPVIRVLGPDTFLRQVRKRVRKQHQLLYERTE